MIEAGALPPQAADDALHIAVAATHGKSADYLHAGRVVGDQAMNDPIVEEVHRVRNAHAARFNYNLDAIFRDIKEQEKKAGYKFVGGVARQSALNQPPQQTAAAMAGSGS